MKRFLPLCALAPGLLLLADAQAKADPSPAPPPTWSYSFAPGQATVNADKGGGVSFTGEKVQTVTTGATNVVLTNLQVFSSTPAGSSETLSPTAGAYSIGMTLGAGSQSTNLTFTGNMSGTLNSQSAIISNTFTGQTTQTVTLNGLKFTVTLFDPKTGNPYYTAPNPPSGDPNGRTLPGSIGAYVTVAAASGGGPGPASAPEPSTLLLSCLGLSFLGVGRWRKGSQVSVTLG